MALGPSQVRDNCVCVCVGLAEAVFRQGGAARRNELITQALSDATVGHQRSRSSRTGCADPRAHLHVQKAAPLPFPWPGNPLDIQHSGGWLAKFPLQEAMPAESCRSAGQGSVASAAPRRVLDNGKPVDEPTQLLSSLVKSWSDEQAAQSHVVLVRHDRIMAACIEGLIGPPIGFEIGPSLQGGCCSHQRWRPESPLSLWWPSPTAGFYKRTRSERPTASLSLERHGKASLHRLPTSPRPRCDRVGIVSPIDDPTKAPFPAVLAWLLQSDL